MVAPRVIAALAKAPELVDSARRPGSNIGFLVADMFAFGTRTCRRRRWSSSTRCWPARRSTVLAEFFPNFSSLDKFDAPRRRSRDVPTTIICGTKDQLTSIGHSRKMAAAAAERPARGVRGRRPHGDLRGPRPGQRRARGRSRASAARSSTTDDPDRRRRRAPPTCSPSSTRRSPTGPPLDPPATALEETEETVARGARRARRPARRARGPARRRAAVRAARPAAGAAPGRRARQGAGPRRRRPDGLPGARDRRRSEASSGLELEARVELPETVSFWRNLGYVEAAPQRQPAAPCCGCCPITPRPAHRRGHPRPSAAGWPPCSRPATW